MKHFTYSKILSVFLGLIFSLSTSVLFSQRPVKSIPYPQSWIDNENVLLMHPKGMKRVYYSYNVKSGEMTETDPVDHSVLKPTVKVQDGNVIYENIKGEEVVLTQSKDEDKNPLLSPDYKQVAFTRNNDIYTFNIETRQEMRHTFDGSDLIMNGYASWVYFEEILGRASQYRAFWWSPDSKKIAFYRFDDSKVPVFPIYHSTGMHGKLLQTRYPKAGDPNPEVSLGIIHLDINRTFIADFDETQDQYFGTPYWSKNSVNLMVQWMDRDQSNFILYNVNAMDGSKKPLYKEYQSTWIDWIEEIYFGDKGFYFVRDFDLWEQIYYQSYDGETFEKLTGGKNWGINILDVKNDDNAIFFSARRDNSLRNDIYMVEVNGRSSGKVIRISSGEYNYRIPKISPDGKYVAAINSSVKDPDRLVLMSAYDGEKGKAEFNVIADSRADNFDEIEIPHKEIVYATTKDGYRLPGLIVYPFNFDENKKYPVIVNVYGGPNHTNVMDIWSNPTSATRFWAAEGVIQVYADNRASGHFGKEAINQIHRRLGYYEVRDYMSWGEYLISLPYVDENRLGITGFSYGGTMTVAALTEGSDYFRFGVAGAGVYDWRLYDSHYTERYMDHPDDNPEGYFESAVTNKVSLYKSGEESSLFLTHGTADDNVHLQNTMQLIDALQKEGKTFELMLYPEAYHGYRGYQGVHYKDETVNFWKKAFNLE